MTSSDAPAIARPQVVRYRRAEAHDVPALLAFWEAHSGWGAVTAAQWHTWYHEGPWGPATIVIAEDEAGQIAGQMAFTPCDVWVDGASVRAARLSAPIIRADLRDTAVRRTSHPILQLFFTGVDVLRDAGVELLYARPAPAWAAFLELMRRIAPHTPGATHFALRSTLTYACVQRDALAPPITAPAGLTTDTQATDDELDALWARGRTGVPVQSGAVRDATYVRFRLGGYALVTVRDVAGQLRGYVAADLRARLLVDVFAESPDCISDVLQAGLAALFAQSPGVMKAVETPLLANTLQSLGFTPIDYTFLLACDWLDGRADLSSLARERWFLGGVD